MNTQKTTITLYYYSGILLICGILLFILNSFLPNLINVSVVVTAIISGVTAFFMSKQAIWSFWTGIIISTLSVFYFGWLTYVNLTLFVDMVFNGEMHLAPYSAVYNQASTMFLALLVCFVSVIISLAQFVRSAANDRELSS
jgi:hypothetical protein